MPLAYKIYMIIQNSIFFCYRGELYKPKTILENLENLKRGVRVGQTLGKRSFTATFE